MSEVVLKVTGNPSNLHSPQHPGDAGHDLAAAHSQTLYSHCPEIISTGVYVEIPEGYAGFILPRSSACKTGVTVTNAPGLIDSGYRGEIKVGLTNMGRNRYRVQAGDRIAQLVIMPVPRVQVVVVDELSPADRGEDGFGSTGR